MVRTYNSIQQANLSPLKKRKMVRNSTVPYPPPHTFPAETNEYPAAQIQRYRRAFRPRCAITLGRTLELPRELIPDVGKS